MIVSTARGQPEAEAVAVTVITYCDDNRINFLITIIIIGISGATKLKLIRNGVAATSVFVTRAFKCRWYREQCPPLINIIISPASASVPPALHPNHLHAAERNRLRTPAPGNGRDFLSCFEKNPLRHSIDSSGSAVGAHNLSPSFQSICLAGCHFECVQIGTYGNGVPAS